MIEPSNSDTVECNDILQCIQSHIADTGDLVKLGSLHVMTGFAYNNCYDLDYSMQCPERFFVKVGRLAIDNHGNEITGESRWTGQSPKPS